jgi:uncharacterized DUF497 family protein
MNFEWDEAKARSNLAKHGVSFEFARRVWDDPFYSLIDQIEDGEERWLAIGIVGGTTILAVVHVYRGDEDNQIVRIISARKATPRERRRYERQTFQS